MHGYNCFAVNPLHSAAHCEEKACPVDFAHTVSRAESRYVLGLGTGHLHTFPEGVRNLRNPGSGGSVFVNPGICG